MTRNSSEILDHFFSITNERISSELNSSLDNFKEIDTKPIGDDPEAKAESFHRKMIKVYGYFHHPRTHLEIGVFYASCVARYIAQEAVNVAYDKDTLAKISDDMKQIRVRENIPQDALIDEDEAPIELLELDDKHREISQNISDTVVASILARYKLLEVVELFEKDGERFEEYMEIGRQYLGSFQSDPFDILN